MLKKILVIEDYPSTYEMIENLLEVEGYQPIIATDSSSGIDKAFSEEPDLILLDIILPGMSGFEVCKILKSDPKTAKIPIVIVSLRSSEENIKMGKAMGADEYLTKPFDPLKLIEVIKKYLGE